MGGFADVVSLTAPFLRVGLCQAAAMLLLIPWMELLLVRRKKRWLMLLNMGYILIVMNWLMNGILGQYYSDEFWW